MTERPEPARRRRTQAIRGPTGSRVEITPEHGPKVVVHLGDDAGPIRVRVTEGPRMEETA